MMDTRETAHRTVVDGSPISWTELGAGVPLVLIHGLFDSHRTWRRAAPLLAREFRVLIPDLPGHGWSGRPDASYSLAWYARVMTRWMDAIGLAKAHVCGHSLGGGIAQWMLLDDRSRIDRLALVAPGGLGPEVSVALRLATVPLLGPALTPPIVWLGVLAGSLLFPRSFGGIELDEARLLIRMHRIRGTSRALRRSLAKVIDLTGQYVQTIDRAHEIMSPPAIALFWGSADPIIPAIHGAKLLEHFTGVTLATYPGCGHFPQLETPTVFARDLSSYLSDPVRPRAALLSRPRAVVEQVLSAPPGEHLLRAWYRRFSNVLSPQSPPSLCEPIMSSQH